MTIIDFAEFTEEEMDEMEFEAKKTGKSLEEMAEDYVVRKTKLDYY